MSALKRNLPNLLSNLFFLWVLVHFGMGGWRQGYALLQYFGLFGWLVLGAITFLIVYTGDYRNDLPLFTAGLLLGYWGEWWGTTRGVWTYWNGATPPVYLPPLWGIGLITVYRLSLPIQKAWRRPPGRLADGLLRFSFLALPALGVALSWERLAQVDWRGRLDAHFFAGIAVAAILIAYRFDLRKAFPIYLCGTLLGGFYEAMGTQWGEWAYVTAETPPLWIAPLWGLASVAMVALAAALRTALERSYATIGARARRKAPAGGD